MGLFSKENKAGQVDLNNLPCHVAVIMDGNGRWAQKRGLPRSAGHKAGAETFRKLGTYCKNLGIDYLTVYAFSTENWGRPAEQIDALMELFCRSVASETPELSKQGVRLAMIGDRGRFPAKVQEYLAQAERETAGGERLTLILALNYSSRSELVRAVRLLAGRVAAGELPAEAIDEQTVGSALYTAPYPDPDLVIRTSGEMRLSNFLLWQSSYAELYFPDVLWPDFTEADFDRAMEVFARRDRRFGLVQEN